MFKKLRIEVCENFRIKDSDFPNLKKLVGFTPLTLVNFSEIRQKIVFQYENEIQEFSVHDALTLVLPNVLFNNHYKRIREFHRDILRFYTVKELKSPRTIKAKQREKDKFTKEMAIWNAIPSGKSSTVLPPEPPREIATNKDQPSALTILIELYTRYAKTTLKNKNFKF